MFRMEDRALLSRMCGNTKVFKGIPQRGATPILIEIAAIAIEIGRLLEIDIDHDFDFDIDPEFRRFENKIVLRNILSAIDRFAGTR
jgi:hypothetical protein